MTQPRGELTTYRVWGGHATDWANPTRSFISLKENPNKVSTNMTRELISAISIRNCWIQRIWLINVSKVKQWKITSLKCVPLEIEPRSAEWWCSRCSWSLKLCSCLKAMPLLMVVCRSDHLDLQYSPYEDRGIRERDIIQRHSNETSYKKRHHTETLYRKRNHNETSYKKKHCYQGCHSHKISKFPDFSLTYLHFSLTDQTYKN